MNKTLVVILGIVAVLVGLVWYIYHHHADCSFSGWKQTVGVDLDVAVGDLQGIKGKVGITDQQVRDFDELMKDFALKYDADCQDSKQGRMNNAEYLCRRNNMEKTLDKVRIFLEKVKAATSLSDPGAQREIILKSLDDMEVSMKSDYAGGCTSTMVVDPKQLSFADHTPERALQISNGGNNALNFTAGILPNGFLAQPKTGSITPGSQAAVVIYRTIEPLPAERPLVFHVLSNFQEDIVVEIDVDAQNSEVYAEMANQVRQAASAQNRQPTIDDALKVVDHSFQSSGSPPGANRDSMRYFVAAGVLSHAGNAGEAERALDMATSKNPSLAKDPSTLLLRGVVVNQQGHPDLALQHFAEANKLVPEEDKQKRALSDLLSGAVTLKKDEKSATALLAKPEVQKSVQENPKVLEFASKQLRVENLGKAVQKAAAAKPH